MGASTRSPEQLADPVGEATGDRQPDELLVVVDDRRAGAVRVGLEVDRRRSDLEAREGDLHRELHVMDRERIGIVVEVQPRWLLVPDRPLDEETVVGEPVRPHPVLPVVQHGRIPGWGRRQDVVGREQAHPADLSDRAPRFRTVVSGSSFGPDTEDHGAMHVVVCVKQVPDPAVPGVLDGSGRLVRGGKLLLDEADSFGVEMGLQLVDAAGGGEVSLVSMGPGGEVSGLRTALAMGASRGVLVSDEVLVGADALLTARVLAGAVGRLGGVDVVLAGTESSDGYTGTVPEMVAGVLGWPSVTFAKSVVVESGVVRVARQTELGFDEVVCPLPCVVSVTAGVVEPRYPSFKGIMAAKSKPVDVVSAGDVGVVGAVVGQRVVGVVSAPVRAGGEVVVDDGEGFRRVVGFLEGLKLV